MADSQGQDNAFSLPHVDHEALEGQASQPIGPVLEHNVTKSPTDGSTLHDSAYSPTSSKENSPTETKPHLDTANAEVDSKESSTPQLSKPFRAVQAVLQKVGAFRIPAVRRVWSEVANDAPGTFADQNRLAKSTWKSTFFRFGPLSGIFCMLGAVSTMIASLGILVGSNGQPVDSWSAPPSTYLAVSTAIANLGMGYACTYDQNSTLPSGDACQLTQVLVSGMQGVVIAWWVRALRGSNFAKLHHDWRSGTTLRGALTAGRHMGLLGLACIFSTFVVIDGPLLQRSSMVVTGPTPNHAVPLNVTMVQELPTGWSGNWLTGTELQAGAHWTESFNATMPSGACNVSNNVWCAATQATQAAIGSLCFTDAPLSGVLTGCSAKKCRAILRAPALAPKSCITSEVAVNYSVPVGSFQLMMVGSASPPLRSQAFGIANALIPQERESIGLTTSYARTTDYAGTQFMTSCEFDSAVGDYNVTIENDLATLDSPAHPTIVAITNNTAVNQTINPSQGARDSTLAGIVKLNWDKYVTGFSMMRANGSTQAQTNNGQALSVYIRDSTAACPYFADPHEDVVASLNKLMVYAGFVAATRESPGYLASRMDPGLKVKTTTIGHLAGTESVYYTDFRFFVAAIVVELVCVVLVAPTYWNWWKLGRAVSFSPLEIAKAGFHWRSSNDAILMRQQAFESPLLSERNSNLSGREMARKMEDACVQYGVVGPDESSDRGTELSLANPGAVEKPQSGMLIDI